MAIAVAAWGATVLPPVPLFVAIGGATGLLFPLQLLAQRDANDGLVRTILAVDDVRQSLTFAGDIPQGARAQQVQVSRA